MKKNGSIIAELRREAGYTQKTLAKAMSITDKAISKWERGLSLPDVALLPKLSALLEVDIELLLPELSAGTNSEWAGLIDLRRFDRDLAQPVYDKPMVYYILAHFLLMDIREICLLGCGEKQSWLAWKEWEQFGMHFRCDPPSLPHTNLMIMKHPCFLFGSDLTRRYRAVMSTGQLTKLCPEWDITPFLFCPAEYVAMYGKKPDYLFDTAMLKSLGRGVVCMPMDTADQIGDVASFVRMYQATTGLAVQDLGEIAARRQPDAL